MNIIVSLASYEKRFPTLHLCLKTIINQSIKPDKFLLYLDHSYKTIPHQILEFQEKGMEICIAETDLKSHNKYFYAIQRYPDDILITLDDDVLYPNNLISNLLQTYRKYPFAVSAGRVHKMRFDANGYNMPYDTWEKEAALYNKPSMDLLATGVGGILYPPHCMDKRLFDKEKIQRLCLYGDDIWLKVMQLLKGTPVVAIQQEKQHPPIIGNTQQCGLHIINKKQHRNDLYIKNVFHEYNFIRKDIKNE